MKPGNRPAAPLPNKLPMLGQLPAQAPATQPVAQAPAAQPATDQERTQAVTAPAQAPTPAPTQTPGPAQSPAAHTAAAPAQASRPATGGADVEVIRRAWPEILQTLTKIKRSSWALVGANAQVAQFDGQLLTLAFSTDGLASAFSRADHAENLRQAIHKTIGIDCQITSVVGGNSSGSSEPNPKAPADPAPPVAGGASPAVSSAVDSAWGLAPAAQSPAAPEADKADAAPAPTAPPHQRSTSISAPTPVAPAPGQVPGAGEAPEPMPYPKRRRPPRPLRPNPFRSAAPAQQPPGIVRLSSWRRPQRHRRTRPRTTRIRTMIGVPRGTRTLPRWTKNRPWIGSRRLLRDSAAMLHRRHQSPRGSPRPTSKRLHPSTFGEEVRGPGRSMVQGCRAGAGLVGGRHRVQRWFRGFGHLCRP